jgi:hypothetical protein
MPYQNTTTNAVDDTTLDKELESEVNKEMTEADNKYLI